MNRAAFMVTVVAASVLVFPSGASSAEEVACKIVAEIGGGQRHTATLTVKDGELHYLKGYFDMREPDPPARRPSKEEWARFRATLEEIDVWQWKRNYSMPLPKGAVVVDGSSWSVTIECADRKVTTSGSDAYPGDRAVDKPSPEHSSRWMKLSGALERLGGGTFTWM